MNSRIINTLLVAVGLLATAGAAQAQTATDRAYVIDARNEVAKSGFGLCWRTGFWTPAAAANDAAGCACDKDLMPKAKCEPVAAKPAPVAVAAAVPKKCDFAATLKDDQTFAFGKATLKPAALAQIDREVIAKLANCAEVKLLLVTGHTDRIGSQQTNQKLSEKRADAVKAYLQKKGVKADIETMGAGKTQAVPGVSCSDKLPRKKLIDCLAPNRRTVVEVQGLAK
ncbi:MAG: OmpA family protein [Rhodocyclaceae bacterium]